jgi:hypothetical protein
VLLTDCILAVHDLCYYGGPPTGQCNPTSIKSAFVVMTLQHAVASCILCEGGRSHLGLMQADRGTTDTSEPWVSEAGSKCPTSSGLVPPRSISVGGKLRGTRPHPLLVHHVPVMPIFDTMCSLSWHTLVLQALFFPWGGGHQVLGLLS